MCNLNSFSYKWLSTSPCFEKEARGNLEMANFSLQYRPWIKHKGHENKGNDHQLKKLLIFIQILLVST